MGAELDRGWISSYAENPAKHREVSPEQDTKSRPRASRRVTNFQNAEVNLQLNLFIVVYFSLFSIRSNIMFSKKVLTCALLL